MPITFRRRHLLALAASVLAIGQAQAQAFPSKPIKLIVGFAPGGTVDILAPAVAQQIGATLSIKPH
jgi:tripartite-type tricarboxylate transporter receptor subunit TctC